MTLDLDLQIALDMPGLPAEADLHRWAEAALVGADYQKDAELTIRIVNEAEITALNESYRHKQGPTNVLSFPFEPPPEIVTPLLGDIVICAPVVLHEAINQGKAVAAHWAHLVAHGVLHLLGYDHDEEQAEAMESLEVRILEGLGYPDPYGELQNP
ncbi:putative metal-dependent hydrolase [Candidatus Competibacter denitrificans Run_A_D11]|uniref:Endoribonuclease YbeY n=1 Tax=Candidatus Competibacter denitrificans Run_A_D11 TaxID=1400863 RepID=W6M5M2_9GAMM|nr:rRNA maturation RNase YbeY [Candidatus Competibacter denitrificans]CDI01055.1 putative metal-dependent hydrolase [Candidatus Competibacter denitrificans Run_A_D11]HRC68986.1 rRNA maturation RNase YbeY [Candidatus Competibacter denitrificans]